MKQRHKRMSLDDRRWYIAARKLRRYDEAMNKIFGKDSQQFNGW